jgi:hypothetical protein
MRKAARLCVSESVVFRCFGPIPASEMARRPVYAWISRFSPDLYTILQVIAASQAFSNRFTEGSPGRMSNRPRGVS